MSAPDAKVDDPAAFVPEQDREKGDAPILFYKPGHEHDRMRCVACRVAPRSQEHMTVIRFATDNGGTTAAAANSNGSPSAGDILRSASGEFVLEPVAVH